MPGPPAPFAGGSSLLRECTPPRRGITGPRRALAMLAAVGLLAGCGLLPGSSGDEEVLDVWLMRFSASDGFVEAAVEEFERRHDGVTVEVTLQDWEGVGDKVTEALTSGEPPDVIEVGTTQVAQYAELDALHNLTSRVIDLDGYDWLPALAETGRVKGNQFGVPYYAANRVVIHRTDLFAEAGLTEPPATREEWLAQTAALDEGEQQGIYLPGQNWYVLAGFVWDEGGDLAVHSGGAWRGALDTPEARAGMEFYAELQALGDGPPDVDEATPHQDEIFAEGDVAQLIATPSAVRSIAELNPDLADVLGSFPIPGTTADAPGAVFTGGSHLVIPADTGRFTAAYDFVKLLTSDPWQAELAAEMGYVPNRTTLAHVVEDDPAAAAMVEAATRAGRAPPQAPHWGAVEADNPIKDYQTAVLTGADPDAAGREASVALTALLAGRARPGP